jgi:hypothetical protein
LEVKLKKIFKPQNRIHTYSCIDQAFANIARNLTGARDGA